MAFANGNTHILSTEKMVRFAQLPRDAAWKFMAEIEAGGIPVLALRGGGQFNPDGSQDYDLMVPATVEALTIVLAMGVTRGWRPALTGTPRTVVGASSQAIFHSWMERFGGLCYAFTARDPAEPRLGLYAVVLDARSHRFAPGLERWGPRGPPEANALGV